MRKTAATMLSLLLFLMPLGGCAVSGGDSVTLAQDAGANDKPPPPVRETGEYVVDASGEKLLIPEGDAVSIASVYAVAVPFIVALGLSDNVVAVNCKSKFWPDNSEGLAKAGSVGRGIVDLEALASYAPDVLIHRTNDPQTVKAVRELGVAAMSIKAESIDEIMDTLDLIGHFCRVEARAEEVKDWMNGKFDQIAALTEGIPLETRPAAVVLGGELGVVAGGDMLQSWMVERAGAISLTAGIEGGVTDSPIASAWANIGVERLFSIDPDVIFCTSSTVLDYTVEEILTTPSFSGLKAVMSGRVYQIPAKWDSWDLPGVSCAIGTMWMLHSLYPELLSAGDLQAEIDGYYTFMFGRTFDGEYLGYETG